MSRLIELYDNEITKKMTEKFGYKNPMMVPKIDKIVINMGVGEAKENSKLLDIAVKEMETIAGQKAVLTRAKNSIANFKLREGQAIGCKVTLRGEKMYEFLDRLVNLALPRVRDFRGVSADSFDGRQTRRADRETPVPERIGLQGLPDQREQRRNLRQHSAHHPAGRRMVLLDRHRKEQGHQSLRPGGQGQ